MKKIILTLIRFYQALPHLRSCRFIPSCSDYLYQVVASYGIVKGVFLGIKRLARCQPGNKGGIDCVA